MNTIRQLTHTRLLAAYSMTALLLIGCGEHLPPSSFVKEEPPAPRVFTRVSLTISIPVVMETYTSTWEARTFPGTYAEGEYEYRSRYDTIEYNIKFATVNSSFACVPFSSGDTVRIQCSENDPAIDWKCAIVLDSARHSIDSLLLTNRGYYTPAGGDDRMGRDVSEWMTLDLKNIPYTFAGDTLVGTIVGEDVENALQSLEHSYYLRERHLPHPHYMNTTQRSIRKVFPASNRSRLSIRMW